MEAQEALRWLDNADPAIAWLLIVDRAVLGSVEYLWTHLPRKNSHGNILFATQSEAVAEALADENCSPAAVTKIEGAGECENDKAGERYSGVAGPFAGSYSASSVIREPFPRQVRSLDSPATGRPGDGYVQLRIYQYGVADREQIFYSSRAGILG